MELMINYQMISRAFDQFIDTVIEVTEQINNIRETGENLDLFWDSSANAEYNMRLNADLYEAETTLKKIKENIVILARIIEKGQARERALFEMISEM